MLVTLLVIVGEYVYFTPWVNSVGFDECWKVFELSQFVPNVYVVAETRLKVKNSAINVNKQVVFILIVNVTDI